MARATAPLLSALALAAMLAGFSAAAAQSIADARRELDRARAESADATARSRAMSAEAGRQLDAAARARAEEAAIAARIQASEADITAAEAQVAIVERLRAVQRERLAARQGPIVRLIAALQMMTRRPAALAVVQPGTITDLVHVRAVLATMLPVIEQRTAGLRAELDHAARLRRLADRSVAELRAGQQRLVAERQQLAAAAVEHRRRSQTLRNDAAFEADRAVALGEQARDLADLMDELGAQASRRDALAALPGPLLRPPSPGDAPMPVAAATTMAAGGKAPPYRLPVNGRVLTGLGEVSRTGVRSRGLTIATAPGAQVIAPAGGRIVYSGAYRGYGQIVIIDHGGGWTSLLTGLDSLAVAVGDTVVQGSPLGRTGAEQRALTVELRRGSDPVDIARMAG